WAGKARCAKVAAVACSLLLRTARAKRRDPRTPCFRSGFSSRRRNPGTGPCPPCGCELASSRLSEAFGGRPHMGAGTLRTLGARRLARDPLRAARAVGGGLVDQRRARLRLAATARAAAAATAAQLRQPERDFGAVERRDRWAAALSHGRSTD